MAVGVGSDLRPDSLCDPGQATHPLWAALIGRALAAVAAGLPIWGFGGGRRASEPSPTPERRLLAGTPMPLWKPDGRNDGSTRAADASRPSRAPGWAVEGWMPAGSLVPLVSGSENRRTSSDFRAMGRAQRAVEGPICPSFLLELGLFTVLLPWFSVT